jgi:serine/threonine-protein kinase
MADITRDSEIERQEARTVERSSAQAAAPGPDSDKTLQSVPGSALPGKPARAGGLPAIAGYEVLGLLGQGGMGVVYKAQQVQPRRPVALKMIRDAGLAGAEELARFHREAQAVADLEHPHIVRLYEVGEHEGQPFLALEYLEGGSLAQRLDGTPWPSAAAARLVEVLARAMHAVHQRGIVHRDLKPHNVLLARSDRPEALPLGGRPEELGERFEPRITDFGLAKQLGVSGQTQSGAILGTPSYMAPEQAVGQSKQLGPAADVYALGAILYELLTGRPPFRAETPLHTLQQVVGQEPVPPSRLNANVARDLETICLKCLPKLPGKRYASALVLADELRRFQNGEPIVARPAGWWEKGVKWARRRPAVAALWAVSVVALLAGGAGVIWLQQQAAERRAEEDRLRQGVEAALERANGLRHEARWGEARAILDQAAERLGDSGPADLRQRVARTRADLDLVGRLDAARLRAATVLQNRRDTAGVERDYAAAFQQAGLGREGEPVATVAARIRHCAVRSQVVAALDDWARITTDRQRRRWLLAVARDADPDPWRDRVRDPAVWGDRAALQRLARRAPMDQLSPQLLATLGSVLALNKGDAVPLLTAARERYPDDFWLNFEVGNVLAAAGQREQAVGYYRAAQALRPKSGAVYNNLGTTLDELGRHDEAIACFHRAIALDPRFAVAYRNLGNALEARGQMDQSLAAHQKAVALDPGWALAHYNLGRALDDKGRLDEAIAEYRKSIALDPKYVLAHNNLGVTLGKKGQLDAAMASYRKALALDPKLALAHTGLGIMLARKGRHDEAIACFRKAIVFDPRDALAHDRLGNALYQKGRLEEAIAACQRAIVLDPGNASTHDQLGRALGEQGRLDEAIAAHRKAVALNPRDARAHYHLGNALGDRGRTSEAMASYRQAIALDPKATLAHNNLGNALYDQGKVDEAIACYRRAIAADPRSALAWNNLGRALHTRGQTDEAIAAFRQAIAIDPRCVLAYTNLGLALEARGRLDEALAAQQQAVAVAPRDANAHFNLGNAWLAKGRPDEAIAAYRLAVTLDPTDARPLVNLGNTLWAKGQLDEAGAAFQKAIAVAPRLAAAHHNLGSVLAEKGQWDQAGDAYQKAIALDPRFVQAYFGLGQALIHQGRFGPARDSLRRCRELLPRSHPARQAATEGMRHCERLLALDEKLDPVLHGKAQAISAAERAEYARLCQYKKRFHASACLFREAFAAEPKLADDLRAAHRYNAACSAARAASGQGHHAAPIDGRESARWRKQALDWLRADLVLWTRQLGTGKPADRAAVQQWLRHWQKDPDLAGLRDAAWLVNLPDSELRACRRLWADVETLLKRAGQPK